MPSSGFNAFELLAKLRKEETAKGPSSSLSLLNKSSKGALGASERSSSPQRSPALAMSTLSAAPRALSQSSSRKAPINSRAKVVSTKSAYDGHFEIRFELEREVLALQKENNSLRGQVKKLSAQQQETENISAQAKRKADETIALLRAQLAHFKAGSTSSAPQGSRLTRTPRRNQPATTQQALPGNKRRGVTNVTRGVRSTTLAQAQVQAQQQQQQQPPPPPPLPLTSPRRRAPGVGSFANPTFSELMRRTSAEDGDTQIALRASLSAVGAAATAAAAAGGSRAFGNNSSSGSSGYHPDGSSPSQHLALGLGVDDHNGTNGLLNDMMGVLDLSSNGQGNFNNHNLALETPSLSQTLDMADSAAVDQQEEEAEGGSPSDYIRERAMSNESDASSFLSLHRSGSGSSSSSIGGGGGGGGGDLVGDRIGLGLTMQHLSADEIDAAEFRRSSLKVLSALSFFSLSLSLALSLSLFLYFSNFYIFSLSGLWSSQACS
jgi:hypothetical protein